MGFDRTTYMVNETDGQVELCVNVTVPADQNIGDVTFSVRVETQNGTAGMSNKSHGWKLCISGHLLLQMSLVAKNRCATHTLLTHICFHTY